MAVCKHAGVQLRVQTLTQRQQEVDWHTGVKLEEQISSQSPSQQRCTSSNKATPRISATPFEGHFLSNHHRAVVT